ncbi:MAG: hypothetical protein Fur003_1960 [Candidatus Dojkabacteria bacterium]
MNDDKASQNVNSTLLNQNSDEVTEYQKYITLQCGTERPFDNEYWDNKNPGIYLDIYTNEPLFISSHKYDSGSGWPSFYQPVSEEAITTNDDMSLGFKRIEVKSKSSGAHLGHLFPDGPKPTGLRYCINSAALKFIPETKMEEAGLGKYLNLVKGIK